ncbi:MAG: bifunctional diaminohydroxyphosphoribosylaminopyrimidine [Pseudomonadota bacterium]|jgi:diaminohydroxyphosphoribosylaminopyrimidine deaminase/5-amino-6-(5-phosphoribosylamino)uracil reductase
MASQSSLSPLKLPTGFGLGGHIPTSITTAPVDATNVDLNLQGSLNPSEELMLRAIVESMRGTGETIPNPAVGCLLTQNGRIVAAGATEKLGGRHAERVAFDNAKKTGISTAGLDAYVTLEPCSHHGRQPPCCELFKAAGIRQLFVSIADPNPAVNGRGLSFVKSEVQNLHLGLCKPAATAWHLPFLVQQRLSRPLIVGKWAQTLDGALADQSGESKWITGPAARAYGHWLRLKYDVTAIGLTTLLLDQPSLTVRDCWRPNNRQPNICIIDALGEATCDDARLNTGLEKILAAAPDRKVALATTCENVGRLRSGVPDLIEILALPEKTSNPEPLSRARGIQQFWESQQLEAWLGRPAQSIFIEGGAKLLSSMLEINALDVMHVFVAPMLLAGEARRLGREENPAPKLSSAAHFDVLSTFALGNDMLVELAARPLVKEFFSEG